MTFGEMLRRLREDAGLTRESLAESSGVPFGTIHGYEIGRRAPSLAAAVKLASALGKSVEVFTECSDVRGTAEPAKGRKPKK